MHTDTKRPWMTALEMQFATLSLARRVMKLVDAGSAPKSVADEVIRRWLHRATAFAWSRDTTTATLLSSRSVPADARFHDDAMPDGIAAAWWWFDSPLPISMDNPIHDPDFGLDGTKVSALLIAKEADGLWIADCRMSNVGPIITGLVVVPLGVTIKEIAEGQSVDPRTLAVSDNSDRSNRRSMELLRFVAAASVWLKQRVVSISSGHVERHRRKQLQREHGITVSDVKVIQLRRTEHEPHNPHGDSEPVEWSCRWIVNGHWRNQYHPSTGKHELKYILPYVKGPSDKPLKVPTHTVYSVNR
jgi:hypothetical protein